MSNMHPYGSGVSSTGGGYSYADMISWRISTANAQHK